MGKENKTDVMMDDHELDEALKLAEARDNQFEYTHELKTPFKWEDKEYTSLSFDWGKLTGRDGLAIEAEMQSLGSPVVIPSLSGEYLARMAARACNEKISVDVLMALPLREFNRIRSVARSFLLRSEL